MPPTRSPVNAQGRLVPLLTALSKFAWRAVHRAWRRRQTRRALARLDDHMLADIGLSRNAFGYDALPGVRPPTKGRRRP